MPQSPYKLTQFWQELRRRKVLPFLIGYVAACFALIEFFDITQDTFSIPQNTLKLLYVLAAIGLPIVIILPWIINRKGTEQLTDEPPVKENTPKEEVALLKHNLPGQLTTFIGREKEMQAIREMIGEHRLVTLTGAGGCGKTRLACEVAVSLVKDYNDGVWFVDLSPLLFDDHVAKEIMEVLRIPEAPHQPGIETLAEKIRNQNLLIVLDNCEHLIRASGEVCAKLLKTGSGLKILATSREALNIAGEKIWRVPSLTLIDPKTIINVEHAKGSEAVMLFTDRAQLINPEFELESGNVNEVVTICNKLDGIPLAVELVACRTKHMNAQMILERFSDRFDRLSSSDPGISQRQKTLHATIEWSYNLLSESEKILFERISVFSGGFNLEAAEEICSDRNLKKDSVMEVLSRLVDRSLVQTIKGKDQSLRYNRLETLRQFGKSKLITKKEEDGISARHLDYYLRMAEVAYEEQFEFQLKWVAWYDVEQDNILTALNWAGFKDSARFAKLASFVYWIWRLRSNISSGREYLQKAVDTKSADPETNARAMLGLGLLTWLSGDGQNALPYMLESLENWRRLDNPREEAYALAEISEPLLHSGDYETSLKYSEQGLEIARRLGKQGFINHCQLYLCIVLVHSRQYDKGRPLVEELLDSSEKMGQLYVIESALHLLGDCTVGMKDFKEGEKRYARGIEVSNSHGNNLYAAFDIQGVAFALSGQGRWAKAIRLDAAAREKFKEIGIEINGMIIFWDEWIETYIEGAKKEVGEELTKQYQAEGIALGYEKAIEYALDFNKD